MNETHPPLASPEIDDTQHVDLEQALEEALQQHRRELTEAHRIARLGTWRWVRATDTMLWSPEIFAIMGRDPGTQPGGLAMLLQPDAPEIFRELTLAFQAAVDFGTPYALDIEVPQPDGTSRWIAARGEVESWHEGKVASLRGTIHDITDRKLAELQLALSENRYRSLAMASAEIVWSVDPEGRQLTAVPTWQRFTGASDTAILGFGWLDAVHPEDRAHVLEDWRAAVAAGTIYRGRQRLRRHDGVYRLMEVCAVPVRDSAGRLVEWVGTHTDITEQVRTQDELTTAHRRLEGVLSSITDGLAVLDHDLRYLYFNQTGAAMLGLRAEDVLGKQLGDIYQENRTNSLGEAFRKSMQTGETVQFQNYYATLDKWIECKCYPSVDGLTVFFRDITAERATERALSQSEARLRKLFESNMVGICLPDRFGAFNGGNDEFLRITGYTRAELEAGLVRWDTMTPREYAPLDAAHIAEAAQRGSCTPYEKEYIRKDGTRVPILCGYALLDGSQDEYIGFVLDLSPQKRMEEALRRSEKLATAGRLAASIAHEINNPLESVTNALYLALLDPALAPETRTYLTMAEDELARVAQITTQSLRFHRQSKSSAPADLGEIMDSVLALFSSRLNARQIDVERRVEPGSIVDCFSDEIRQVLANFISNSLDATAPHGRIRIRIRPTHAWDAARTPGVRVVVADTGSGIPEEVKKRIFEPFFSTKEATGLGLGLWVSDGILRKHKARLSIRSHTGDPHGTAISLFFPQTPELHRA